MVKATVKKATPADKSPGVIDLDNPNSADKFARELGVESKTTVGTGETAEVLAEPSPVPEEPAPAPTTALATRPAHAMSRFAEQSGGAFEGEFDKSDLRVPQLKIVNGSGELSQKFNQGTLLFADETLWFPPNPKATNNPSMLFVPVHIKKQFKENLTSEEASEGAMPRVVSTREEAQDLGGTTEWINGEKPRWSPSGTCTLLICEPEAQDREEGDRHPGFSNLLDGKNWALAVYYAGGVAYKETVTTMISNAYTNLKEAGKTCLPKRVWTWQVIKKPAGNFTVFVPSIRLTRQDTGPEARAFISEIFGNTSGIR